MKAIRRGLASWDRPYGSAAAHRAPKRQLDSKCCCHHTAAHKELLSAHLLCHQHKPGEPHCPKPPQRGFFCLQLAENKCTGAVWHTGCCTASDESRTSYLSVELVRAVSTALKPDNQKEEQAARSRLPEPDWYFGLQWIVFTALKIKLSCFIFLVLHVFWWPTTVCLHYK